MTGQTKSYQYTQNTCSTVISLCSFTQSHTFTAEENEYTLSAIAGYISRLTVVSRAAK